MYAIVTLGGHQHKVREGDLVDIDTDTLDIGETVTFDKVILYSDEEGDVRVGKPSLDDVSVIGTVRKSIKGPKTIAIRFKRRKGVRTRHGHRQNYKQVRIDRISSD